MPQFDSGDKNPHLLPLRPIQVVGSPDGFARSDNNILPWPDVMPPDDPEVLRSLLTNEKRQVAPDFFSGIDRGINW